jgi:hypothetical protein
VPSSSYLARLLGPVLAVVGLAMLLRPADYLSLVGDILRSPALLYLASVLGWSPLIASPILPLWGGALVLLVGAVLCYFGYAGARRA